MVHDYTNKCPFCGKVTILPLEDLAVAKFENGALVQDAFPELSATEREVILSGICPECQEKIFGE